MAKVTLRAAAQEDVIACFHYLALNAGEDVGDRFLAGVRAACDLLAMAPEAGQLMDLDPPLHRLRRWPVKGFERWLLVYQHRADVVEIVRVLHGARDVPSTLAC